MGAFLDQVRNGKIAHPTQRHFDARVWRERYEAISEPDTEDTHLFEAGLLFDRILCGLRDKLSEGDFRRVKRRDRLRAICGLINHEVVALSNRLRAPLAPTGSMVPFPRLIEKTVTLRSGIKMTPDQHITTLLDSAILPLDEALQAPDDGQPFTADNHKGVGLGFLVANLYRIATECWHACLWGGKFIERDKYGRIFIRPRDVRLAQQAAVSEHRHQSKSLTATQHCVRLWRNVLSIPMKRAAVIEKGVVGFHRDRRNKFDVAKLNWHRRQNVPLSAVNWVMAYEDYLAPFMGLPLPTFPDLTIEALRKVWDVLGTLGDAVQRSISDQQLERDWLMAHAVQVSRTEIEAVLARSLSLDAEVINSAINFLTYQRRSDGLWQKPLISLSETEFLIAAAPLKYTNLLRTAERWLAQGGLILIDEVRFSKN
jgi:hypothetical protein